MYLGELPWLKKHLSGKLYKLGRLQFAMGSAECDIPEYSIKQGENIIEIHIPAGEKLLISECKKSIDSATLFFSKYFPEFNYRYYTCHFWLLDETIKKYLPENSNILNFAGLFTKIKSVECNEILRFVLRWDASPENIDCILPKSDFAMKIKNAYLGGETFYETMGIIKRTP